MQSRRDAVLKKIIMDRKLSVKARRSALADMQAPSRAFLLRLANDPDAPVHVRLDASRMLPQVEQRMAGARAVRVRQREEELVEQRIVPDEETRRREIDEVLRQAAKELGINLDEQGGSNPIPESPEMEIMGPSPVAPKVPVDGISSEAGSHPEPEPPAVRIPDSPDARADSKRQELLARGRALAASVLVQYERFTRCPHNLQESKRLEDLQGKFVEWERLAHIQHADIDTQEFCDPRLRPAPPKVINQTAYMRQRQVLAIDEQDIICAQPQRAKPAHADSGFWAGAGPGI